MGTWLVQRMLLGTGLWYHLKLMYTHSHFFVYENIKGKLEFIISVTICILVSWNVPKKFSKVKECRNKVSCAPWFQNTFLPSQTFSPAIIKFHHFLFCRWVRKDRSIVTVVLPFHKGLLKNSRIDVSVTALWLSHPAGKQCVANQGMAQNSLILI